MYIFISFKIVISCLELVIKKNLLTYIFLLNFMNFRNSRTNICAVYVLLLSMYCIVFFNLESSINININNIFIL